MSTDVLEGLPPAEVAAWYGRLADLIERQNKTVKDPLAPLFLRHWLKGAGKLLKFPAPAHLQATKYVAEVLKLHRAIFLTEQKTKKGTWGGVIPRLQGQPGFAKWDGKTPLALNYESLVDIPLLDIPFLSDGDKDIFTSLHDFQLRSDVTVTGSADAGSGKLRVTFSSYQAKARDRYDWDPDKHFTVPNPDFGNPAKVAKPVDPKSKTVTVYHKNAIRVEKAGLAAPYDLESDPWTVTDLTVAGPGVVDPGKKL
jgi:hypothetical protein